MINSCRYRQSLVGGSRIIFMELVNALSLEGYLEKESPTVFKIFQRRYFAFRSKGEFMVWFKRKPTSADEDPKGSDSATQV